MKIITERELIQNVATRWKSQYGYNGEWGFNEYHKNVYSNLLSLDTNTATAEDVARIIGNESWSYAWCSLCGNHSPISVITNATFIDEDIIICESCIEKVHSMLVDFKTNNT